jgi:hypothetical protein
MAEYERRANADEKIRSSISVIEALLPLDIDDKLKAKFLSNCLWQITQAEGRSKYEIRYRSQAAMNAPRKQLRHEHVTQRKAMVKALIARPADAREIVAKAQGCVVTKDEHTRLNSVGKSIDGWERYREAGIVVIDMKTGKPFEFPEPTP